MEIIGDVNMERFYQIFRFKYSEYSRKHDKKWILPKHYYTFSKNKDGVTIDFFVIDTNIDLMSEELKNKQFNYIKRKIKESKSRWKILIGHHTFISIAGHGNAEPELDKYLRDLIKEGIDIYMNGHDHNKQIVELSIDDRTVPVITCGTGGKPYDEGVN